MPGQSLLLYPLVPYDVSNHAYDGVAKIIIENQRDPNLRESRILDEAGKPWISANRSETLRHLPR